MSATIVEERSGTSYERFLRREFFDPLGLHDTGYRMAGWSEERPAIGYRAAWGGPCQHCSPIRTSTQTIKGGSCDPVSRLWCVPS